MTMRPTQMEIYDGLAPIRDLTNRVAGYYPNFVLRYPPEPFDWVAYVDGFHCALRWAVFIQGFLFLNL